MSKAIKIVVLRFSFFIALLAISHTFGESVHLPGRLGNEETQWVQLGNADLFFYMTPEKNDLIQKIVQDVNLEKLGLTVDINDYDCFTTEISATASKYPDPIKSQNGSAIYADPQGNDVLNSFAHDLNKLISSQLGLNMEGVSREINLVVNQDAHKFHQDQSTKQFDFLKLRDPLSPPCTIIQDLTLVDWDMSADTLSATILQDSHSEERFLLALFPKESVGMIFAQSPKYLTREAHPSYLVPTIFPYHAVLSPIDRKGGKTAGSSKGKRLSTVVRGVVPECELDALKANSKQISLNRPTFYNDEWIYPDGMIARGISIDIRPLLDLFDQGLIFKHPDRENIEIYELNIDSYNPVIQQLALQFAVDSKSIKNVRLIRLLKRDSGFSALNKMNLPIQAGSEIIILNSSNIPDGYDYYNLARDFTVEGLPWIQLYYLPDNRGFKISAEQIQKLSLTPIEEVLFRKAKEDSMKTDGLQSLNKIVTKIDLFIFDVAK